MKIKIILTSLLIGAFFFTSQAQTNRGINGDQKKQKVKIAKGVKSGELTKAETQQLVKQQKRIQVAENKAKADGTVTRKERAKINAMQTKADRNIHKQKHDAQNRN